MNDVSQAAVNEEFADERYEQNIALLTWIGAIFLSFLPALFFYAFKTNSKFISSHTKEAMNWSFTLVIGYFLASLLSFVAIGVFVFPVLLVTNVVVCIIGCIAAAKGKEFRSFFAIRILK